MGTPITPLATGDVEAAVLAGLTEVLVPLGAKVFVCDPGEDINKPGCAWLDDSEAGLAPRGLGQFDTNLIEKPVIKVTFFGYGEGDNPRDAFKQATARVNVLGKAFTRWVIANPALEGAWTSLTFDKSERAKWETLPTTAGVARYLTVTLLAQCYPSAG